MFDSIQTASSSFCFFFHNRLSSLLTTQPSTSRYKDQWPRWTRGETREADETLVASVHSRFITISACKQSLRAKRFDDYARRRVERTSFGVQETVEWSANCLATFPSIERSFPVSICERKPLPPEASFRARFPQASNGKRRRADNGERRIVDG